MSLGNIELGRHSPAVLRPLSFRGVVMDFPLLVTILAICAYGLIVLYSALEESSSLLLRQGVRLGVAFGAFVVV
jgi:rod shape determining protein RodA